MQENSSRIPGGAADGVTSTGSIGRLVDWLTASLLVLGGVAAAVAGASVYAIRDRSRIARWVAEERLTSSELTDAELVDTTVALLTWGGAGLVLTGILLAVAGAWFLRSRSRTRVDTAVEGGRADTVTLAIVGGVVTLVTSFVPLSPVLGGLVSGYLQGRDGRSGIRVGAYAGLVAAAPFALLGLFLLGGVGVAALELGIVGLGLFVALTLLVSLLASVAQFIALSALGGYLGVALGERDDADDAMVQA